MDNEIKSLPMVPLRGMTIMPGMVVHFDVSRARSIAAVQEAMVEEQKIFPDRAEIHRRGGAWGRRMYTRPALSLRSGRSLSCRSRS